MWGPRAEEAPAPLKEATASAASPWALPFPAGNTQKMVCCPEGGACPGLSLEMGLRQ